MVLNLNEYGTSFDSFHPIALGKAKIACNFGPSECSRVNNPIFYFQFSKEAKFISECFNGSFAQANYRNKEVKIIFW